MFCEKCGTEVNDQAHVCTGCGIKIKRIDVKTSTLVCSYILAIIAPFLGIFAGLYLLAKKNWVHGFIVSILSVIAFFLAAVILGSI